MTDTELGLPLEYQQMPEFFDAHNISHDTEAKNGILAAILARYKVKTVLDLTCGTGSQVFYLTAQNYQVTGADFSPKLLQIARKKAHESNIPAKFIDGDMRYLQVGEFDAAITMFNAVGHLSKEDFEVAIKNINGNLKPGGLYVFDIFNLTALDDDAVNELAMESSKTAAGAQIHHTQRSTLDRVNGLLTSCDEYTIRRPLVDAYHKSHAFTLQIYAAKELRDILARNGFEVEGQYSMDGTPFVEKDATCVLTVARKTAD